MKKESSLVDATTSSSSSSISNYDKDILVGSRSSSSNTRGTAAQQQLPQQQQGMTSTLSSTPAGAVISSTSSSSGLMHSGPLRTVLTPTSSGATIHGGLLVAPPTMAHNPHHRSKQQPTTNPPPIMKQQHQSSATAEVMVLKPATADPLLQQTSVLPTTTKTASEFFTAATTQSKRTMLQPATISSTAPPSLLPQPSPTTNTPLVPQPTIASVLLPPKATTIVPLQPPNTYTNRLPMPDIPTNTTPHVSSSVIPSARSMGSTATTGAPLPPPSTTPVSTVDQEINDFLLHDYNHRSNNHSTSSSSPLLYPEPFPYVDIDDTNVDAMLFQKVLHFAYRRQWNHVIEASNSVFLASREEEVSSSSFDLWKTFQQLIIRPQDEYNHDDENHHHHTPPNNNNNNNKQLEIEARHASLLLSSHTPTAEQRLQREICIMLYLRFIGLVKLRKYTQLGHEIDRLYLIPSTHPTSTNITIPPWVPIGLQIAAIQTLQFTDKPQRCIDTLYQFSNLISMSSDDSLHCWNIRIHATLCNVFVREKKWRMALVSLEYILRHLIDIIPMEVLHCVSQLQMETGISSKDDAISQLILVASRVEVLSRQGRILVQAGAMPEAELLFQRIEEEEYALFCTIQQQMLLLHGRNDIYQRIVNTQWMVQKVSTNVMMNKGIILFAHEKYDEAMKQYTLAIEAERNFYSKDVDDYVNRILHPGVGLDPPEEHSSYLPHCLNNMALCALYSCKMNEAVVILESLVRENPTLYLTETLTFNLCTLYELGSDNATSGKKKRILQLLAKRFLLHDIGSESFRIS